MASKATTTQLTPIDPQCLYPMQLFHERVGLGKSAMRTARRRGLRVLRYGGRSFVLGADFIEHVIACQQHDEMSGASG